MNSRSRYAPVYLVWREGALDRVDPGATTAVYHVDALTGATVTGNAVTNLIRYWFGPDGYQPFLKRLQTQPPVRPAEDGARQ